MYIDIFRFVVAKKRFNINLKEIIFFDLAIIMDIHVIVLNYYYNFFFFVCSWESIQTTQKISANFANINYRNQNNQLSH